jgi:hypothetical protein
VVDEIFNCLKRLMLSSSIRGAVLWTLEVDVHEVVVTVVVKEQTGDLARYV